MPLNTGDQQATSGLAKAIYDVMDSLLLLKPPPNTKPDDLAKLVQSRQALSFAIASGVVAELTGDHSVTPDFAESYSSAAQDANFWSWFGGFIAVFKTWASTTSDGVALQTALNQFLTSNQAPTELKGIVR